MQQVIVIIVFVSSTTAPKDVKQVWEIQPITILNITLQREKYNY